jgi:NADH-quinone oxidoreductase subunit G
MPSVTIDGQSLPFEPGQTIIQVATNNGIDIPHYCWHPRLSVAANCRMCLVEVEKMPKLAPSCQQTCGDGMVVHTKTERVQGAQKAVHQFLLVNHPIDCPICDQAGECKLQDYYMRFQLDKGPMADRKVHKPRLDPLGPYVMYNAERCILCTRCVRFMEEVAEDRQLGVFNRGDHAEIGVTPGQALDSPYSLNTVDVCPVGALTSRAFRFKQRAWYLERGDSLCSGCARGCNVHLDHRSGQVFRMLPRENDAVNKSWLCDEGRLTYARANEPAPAQQGSVARAAELLRPVVETRTGLAVALSAHATCEEAYLVGRLCAELFGVQQIAVFGEPDGEGDNILRVADKNPNRRGIREVFSAIGIEDAAGRGSISLLLGRVGTYTPPAAEATITISPDCTHGDVVLPATHWAQQQGRWVNCDGIVQSLTPVVAAGPRRPMTAWLTEIADAVGRTLPYASFSALSEEVSRRVPGLAC